MENYSRDSVGKFKRREIPRYVFLIMAFALFSLVLGSVVFEPWYAKNTMTYVAPVVEAAEIETVPVEVLEDRLVAYIWKAESGGYVPKDGEILPTFDPNSKMYAECIRIGGRMNKDCLSYGPLQEKIGTIQHFWPKLHDGATLSEKEAREVAEGLESAKRFFLDCSIKIEGCVWNWTTAEKHRAEITLLIELIRSKN